VPFSPLGERRAELRERVVPAGGRAAEREVPDLHLGESREPAVDRDEQVILGNLAFLVERDHVHDPRGDRRETLVVVVEPPPVDHEARDEAAMVVILPVARVEVEPPCHPSLEVRVVRVGT